MSTGKTADIESLGRSGHYWDRQRKKAEKHGDVHAARSARFHQRRVWGYWIEALVTQRGR